MAEDDRPPGRSAPSLTPRISENDVSNCCMYIRNPEKAKLKQFKKKCNAKIGVENYRTEQKAEDDDFIAFNDRYLFYECTNDLTSDHFGPNSIIYVPEKATLLPPWESRRDRTEEEETDPENPFIPVRTKNNNRLIKSNLIEQSQPKTKSNNNENENKTATPQSNETTTVPKFTLKITNHTIGLGSPFFLKSILKQYSPALANPIPQNYCNTRTKITTLNFQNERDLNSFTKNIPSTTFGPIAKYELNPIQNKPKTTILTTQYTGVMRGVDPNITEAELKQELAEANYNITELSRITTKDGIVTHMVRLNFPNREETEKVINQGILMLGRKFRVEPPLERYRHVPCRNCCLYGHTQEDCQNPRKCHRCGEHPKNCTHPKYTNDLIYCATCNQKGHYTGQVKCPLYPKETPPPPKRYTPLVPQTPISPVKPRATAWNFPPLVPENSETESNIINYEKVNKIMDEKIKLATKKIEKYVDEKLNSLKEELLKYFLGVTYNVIDNSERPLLKQVSNSTAKRALNSTIKFVPNNTHLDIFIQKMNQTVSTVMENIQENITTELASQISALTDKT
ncbi:hypothetical protein L9F63_017873 [Diploptera punctata]|uniref:Nucleic-acid-binding protein from transposon X-element n=1 Tax=Diploptera punctata TaxID=6984 RepID=A0AAD8EFP9_DIPPU|nr:hypothetical protein L9F63_017873 [Diploptera punctata]